MKSPIAVGIGSVERETGISKETLRIWERRYGFPHPVRTSSGVRNYSNESIAKLRLVKRLLDRGLRAGDIVPKSIEQLEAIDRSTTTSSTGNAATDRALLPSFRAQDIDQFRLWLRERVQTLSVETFIVDVVRPLCTEIGIAWQSNEIGVFEEHMLSEQIAETLRHLIARFAHTGLPPRILLTTLLGERHGFGLLMLQALLAARGVHCLSLGVETPMGEIVKCAAMAQIDVVALSFSSHFPARRLRSDLKEIRTMLPPTVAIMAGGGAISRIETRLEGINLVPELSDAVGFVEQLRTNRLQLSPSLSV